MLRGLYRIAGLIPGRYLIHRGITSITHEYTIRLSGSEGVHTNHPHSTRWEPPGEILILLVALQRLI